MARSSKSLKQQQIKIRNITEITIAAILRLYFDLYIDRKETVSSRQLCDQLENSLSVVADVVCITKTAPQASRKFAGNIMSGQCIFKCKEHSQEAKRYNF